MQSGNIARSHRRFSSYSRIMVCLLAVLGLASASALLAQEPAIPPTASPAAALPDAPAPAPAPPDPAVANQPPQMTSPPLAIVPLDASVAGAAVSVTGPMQAWNGRAFITSNGEITAGAAAAQVTLPYRGTMNVCPNTVVKLSADTNVPVNQLPGLLMAIDQGALEAKVTLASYADVILTPSFRILVSGPGSADLKVRLSDNGDTCIDNAGANAPYVVVTSQFDSGLYRVQPGQRVMFQHGSLQDVIDQEREPCGCPSPPASHGNEFPLAASQGLAPLADPTFVIKNGESAQGQEVLSYSGKSHSFGNGSSKPAQAVPAPDSITGENAPATPATPKPKRKPGLLRGIGRFFKFIFGAES